MPKKKNKKIIYKICISLIFGLAGFFINFHTIIFPFGEYTAVMSFGLLFPMLIALVWGWKYGLLSALAGGCQSMWWLWGPSNGYAIFLVVPPFTLWVAWHGYFANLRRKRKNYNWWLSMYVVEIPFRILSTINLYTLSRWAITLNPPPWRWALDAPSVIPMNFSNFVVIKQFVVGFIILLLADVILNFRFARKFFRLKVWHSKMNKGYIISVSFLFGCFFWLLDSIFEYFVCLKCHETFFDTFVLNITPGKLFVRIIFILICLACGLLINKFLQKQLEAEVELKKSYEKLKESNELKDQFLNMASHELKSPLIPIRSQCQLLLGEDYGALNKDQKEAVKMIYKNENHLERLVTDVLDISKARSKKLKVIFKKADIGKIISDAIRNIKKIAKDKNVTFSLEITPKLPQIFIDFQRISQTIANLLGNALKHTSVKGTVAVMVDKAGGNIRVSVHDDGIGMDKKTLKKIFTPFFQADRGLERKYGGSGLGLSICKEIVEAHGGKIWGSSKGKNKGSTFIFTLPLKI